MVCLGEVWVLLVVRRHDPSDSLLLRPLGGRHQGTQPKPARVARHVVVAVPTALEEENPLSTGRIPPDVVTCWAAVVARHVPVVEELPSQPVLLLVASGVEDGCQPPEGVLGQPGLRGLQRVPAHRHEAGEEEKDRHPGKKEAVKAEMAIKRQSISIDDS